jgi:hypothetical protein
MRAWIRVIIALALLAWLIAPRIEREVPDPELWGFERTVDNPAVFERARAAGRLHEDPTRRRLRQAVLDAGSRLEFSPCDEQLKPPLRAAIDELLAEQRKTAGQPIETVTIDGEIVDASAFLSKPAAGVIREAKDGGLLHKEDFSLDVGILFPPTPPKLDRKRRHGRFVCADE